jgi:hypothetical protein
MPYGYTGQNLINQTVKNSGVFSISDVADLEKQGKFGGSLELIEEQTFSSSVAQVDFTSIQESKYDVHLVNAKVKFGSGNSDLLGIRFFESGTLETASVYKIATQFGKSNGTFGEARQTAFNYIFLGEGTTAFQNCYIYLYNLGDSSKYSFCTFHTEVLDSSNNAFFRFGGAVLPQASTVDGIRFFGGSSGNNIGEDFDIKLYGVKQL